MRLVEHAKREFELLGWPGECPMQKEMCDCIIELLETFSNQGHTGMTAPYALAYFDKLAKFDPISPLTGDEDEWCDVSEEIGEPLYQNKRDGEVFKDGSGQAYWIGGKIFREPNGCTFTSSDSCVPVTFPWTKPDPEIIDVQR